MTSGKSIWNALRGFIKHRSGVSTVEYGVIFAAGMMVTIPAANTLYTTMRGTLQNTQTSFKQQDAAFTIFRSDNTDQYIDGSYHDGRLGTKNHFAFEQGGGKDYIVGAYWGTNVIAFGEGITASNLSYHLEGMHLVIDYGNGDQVTMHAGIYQDGWGADVIQFSDGTTLNPYRDVTVQVDAKPGDQQMYGMYPGKTNVTLSQGDGIDGYNAGYWADDTFTFAAPLTASDVSLRSADGDLIVVYGSGDEVRIPWGAAYNNSAWGVERFKFSDGTTRDVEAFNMSISLSEPSAKSGNWTWGLSGSATSGATTDVYGSAGDGNHTYYCYDCTDTLHLDGAKPSQVSYTMEGQNLVVMYGNGDKVVNSNCYGNSSPYCLNSIVFGDGSTQDMTSLPVSVADSDGDQTLYGYYCYSDCESSSMTFTMTGGNDTVWSYGATDTMMMPADISPEKVSFSVDGQNMIIDYGSGSITIANGTASTYAIEKLVFSDGTQMGFNGSEYEVIAGCVGKNCGEQCGDLICSGGGYDSPPIYSDRRLKHDIHSAGTLANGVKLYTYKYLNSNQVFLGVMAQDLLADARFRDSVVKLPHGFYAVNYRKLGLKPANEKAMMAAGKKAYEFAARKQAVPVRKDSMRDASLRTVAHHG